MTITLQLLTEDPEEIQLAERYWAMNEDGEFLEKVNSLVPFRHIVQSGSLAAYVRQLCHALDDNQTCRYCDRSIEVKSRSTAKKYPQQSYKPCSTCQTVLDKREQASKVAAALELEKQLTAYIAQLPSDPIDYATLRDDHVLLLLALEAAISPRLINEAFKIGDCDALAPQDCELFILPLYEAKIVLEDPRRASPGAYFLEDAKVEIYYHDVVYSLAADKHMGRNEEAFSQLRSHRYTDTTRLFELWLDFATTDAMRYLHDKCKSYNQQLDEKQLSEIRSTLRTALKTWSVSQAWFVIWKTVKDAASLSQQIYYTVTKATATIPGKIRRTLEKVEKDGSKISKWDRPDQQPAGTLGMLFNELFGVDEDTPGIEVLAKFSALVYGAGDIHDPIVAKPVRELLTSAMINDDGPRMMQQFATLIRGGYEVDAAIKAMLETVETKDNA